MPGRSGPKPSAAGITAATTSIRTSTAMRSSTRSPTAPSSISTAATSPAAKTTHTTFGPRDQGDCGRFRVGPHAVPCPYVQRPDRSVIRRQDQDDPNLIWAYEPAGSESLSIGMGQIWSTLSSTTNRYNEAQRGTAGQPGHLDGPHGGSHRAGNHLRRHVQLRTRHSAPDLDKLTADSPAPLTAAGRRVLSDSATGPDHQARILTVPPVGKAHGRFALLAFCRCAAGKILRVPVPSLPASVHTVGIRGGAGRHPPCGASKHERCLRPPADRQGAMR